MIALYIILAVFLLLVAASIISYDLTWAMLYPKELMPNETLKRNHDDWPWGFRWVPRRLTAFLNGPSPRRKYPKQLFGTNKRIFTGDPSGKIIEQDVPDPGTWCVSWPPAFSLLTKKGTLFRLAIFRKDYWDGIYGYWVFLAFGWHKN